MYRKCVIYYLFVIVTSMRLPGPQEVSQMRALIELPQKSRQFIQPRSHTRN